MYDSYALSYLVAQEAKIMARIEREELAITGGMKKLTKKERKKEFADE